ncbi:hypothetical protein ACFC25_04295 [Pseudarthrobacter sp. NPDC055928]|uniref:hypothetical protein n=1 Tax=Pseudarthrobacter sp. NPDC055928 TaxID=3345661 RepID=UPI0035DAB037
MNNERIAQIEARLNASTPGPWGNADDTYRSIPVHRIGSEVTGSDVAQVMLMGKQSAADADFIANAPEDLRYLLDLLRASR